MFQVPSGFSIKVSIDSNFKLKNSDKSLTSDAIKSLSGINMEIIYLIV